MVDGENGQKPMDSRQWTESNGSERQWELKAMEK